MLWDRDFAVGCALQDESATCNGNTEGWVAFPLRMWSRARHSCRGDRSRVSQVVLRAPGIQESSELFDYNILLRGHGILLNCCKTKLRESHIPDVFCARAVASAVGANMENAWHKNLLEHSGTLVFSVIGRGSCALQIIISVLQQWWALQAVLGVHVMGTVSQFLAHVLMADLTW